MELFNYKDIKEKNLRDFNKSSVFKFMKVLLNFYNFQQKLKKNLNL